MTTTLELAAAHKALATALEKVHAAEQRIIKASAPSVGGDPTPEPTPASALHPLKYPGGTRVRLLKAPPAHHSFVGCEGAVVRALESDRTYSVTVHVDGVGEIPFLDAEIEAIPEEPTLWGYKVGDRVRYTNASDDAIHGIRVVGAIESEPTRLCLDAPDGRKGIGFAHSADRIRKVV